MSVGRPPPTETCGVHAGCQTPRPVRLDGSVARRSKTKKKRPSFGIPKEIILLSGQDVWPFTFVARGWGGGCGKVPMPADAALQDVQTAIFTSLADYTRTAHGVEIDVEWSSLTPDSWVGHFRQVTAEEPAPPEAAVLQAAVPSLRRSGGASGDQCP